MRYSIRSLAALLLLAAPLALVPTGAQADIGCKMHFSMKGWSVFYKTYSGHGTVTCSNGQTAKVHLSSKGGGLVAGKSSIDDGHGDFAGVTDISQIYGDYASAEGEAGAVKSAAGTVVTKGEISLSLSGTGRGWDLGVSFNSFKIKPYVPKAPATTAPPPPPPPAN